ncbi:methyltransferase domain-containing protein [Nitratireductor sp. XY-223]|uniref:protein-L-isoaspartate O-methyltransferase family protein n=1 Tax=Nitratireductor sp. XY-223 TaxID=2561926 RepID=UPI0010AA8B37|nr:methyltransferase domain-containing protein [Nitratireductor sp. XY-223]
MTSEEDLRIVRRAYAKQVSAAFGVTDTRIEDAFAEISREAFLGSGPWQIFRFGRGYVPTPDDDAVYLYTDDLVGILPERHINNGQPSLHAYLLSRASPREGEHIVHIGAGVGYYSAIMAQLVGRSGRVTAIEFDAELAERAKANLSGYANVSIVQGDGSVVPFVPADVVYVNAGATRPADSWLDGLKDGGRLVLPLTTDKGFTDADWGNMHLRGAVFLIERDGAELGARWISPVAIFPCEGMRDTESEKALAAAFDGGDCRQVKRLYRTGDVPAEQCWLRAPGWCLAYS